MLELHANGLTVDDKHVPENPVTGIVAEHINRRSNLRDRSLLWEKALAEPLVTHVRACGSSEIFTARVDEVYGHVLIRTWINHALRVPAMAAGEDDIEVIDHVACKQIYRKLSSGLITETFCAPTDADSPVLEPIAAEHPVNHYMSAETISAVKAVLGTNSGIKTLAPILNDYEFCYITRGNEFRKTVDEHGRVSWPDYSDEDPAGAGWPGDTLVSSWLKDQRFADTLGPQMIPEGAYASHPSLQHLRRVPAMHYTESDPHDHDDRDISDLRYPVLRRHSCMEDLDGIARIRMVHWAHDAKTAAQFAANIFGEAAAMRPDLVRAVARARPSALYFTRMLWDESMPVDWAVGQLDRLRRLDRFAVITRHMRGTFSENTCMGNVDLIGANLELDEEPDAEPALGHVERERDNLRRRFRFHGSAKIHTPGFLPRLDRQTRARLIKRRTTIRDLFHIEDIAGTWRDIAGHDNDTEHFRHYHDSLDAPELRFHEGPLPGDAGRARVRNWREMEYELNGISAAAHAEAVRENERIRLQMEADERRKYLAWLDTTVAAKWLAKQGLNPRQLPGSANAASQAIKIDEVRKALDSHIKERSYAATVALEILKVFGAIGSENTENTEGAEDTEESGTVQAPVIIRDRAGRGYVVATHQNQLRRWAAEMRNCIAGYSADPMYDNYMLIGVLDGADGDRPIVNAQIRLPGSVGSNWAFMQFETRYGMNMADKTRDEIRGFMSSLLNEAEAAAHAKRTKSVTVTEEHH